MTSKPITDPDIHQHSEPKPKQIDPQAVGRTVLLAEAEALRAASGMIDEHFERAVGLLTRCADAEGTVLVSGLGKSGLVGAKIAATLSSLGVTAHPVHPTEAAHGDLGRFRERDVAICLSHSGETEEVVALASILRQDGLPIISITRGRSDLASGGRPESSLERLSDCVLRDGVEQEASGVESGDRLLAPTSSTTAAMAIGDALALAVAYRRRFTSQDFARRHPGGQLGGLLRPVTDLLRFRAGEGLATVEPTVTVAEAVERTGRLGRRPGALLITEPGTGRLAGIFTDGDLRRLIARDPAELQRPIGDVMTANPRSLHDSALARDAVHLVRQHRADEIPVIDSEGRPVGVLDVQDLVAMRLVTPG